MSRNYMILSTSETGSVNYSEVLQSGSDTHRTDVSGSLTFVKWEGVSVPASINALTTKDGPYTYSEMVNILTGSEWTSEES
jgi:hypothetical protein